MNCHSTVVVLCMMYNTVQCMESALWMTVESRENKKLYSYSDLQDAIREELRRKLPNDQEKKDIIMYAKPHAQIAALSRNNSSKKAKL